MKLIHLSDLHLGKRLYEYSMLEDQAFILKRILSVVAEEKPQAVLIAGDVYDKSVPSAEAVSLFDEFLVSLSRLGPEVFVISGNHDSPERIAFASRILDVSGVHMSPVYDGHVAPVTLEDEFGPVEVYMLPFIKPVHVRRFHEDAEIGDYTEALRCAVADMNIDPTKRSVLLAHQFVTGAARSESEEVSVGGLDNVDAEVFADFDYVALGHLHTAQCCGAQHVRYCGTPLQYSFSEAKDRKSLTVVELGEKGSLAVRTVELLPRRALVELRGSYAELTLRSFYEGTSWQEDYVRVILTDEEDVPDAIGKLRTVYHNIARLDYDNARTRSNAVILSDAEAETKTPQELFSDFYELQNNQPMSAEQTAYMNALIENIWEGKE